MCRRVPTGKFPVHTAYPGTSRRPNWDAAIRVAVPVPVELPARDPSTRIPAKKKSIESANRCSPYNFTNVDGRVAIVDRMKDMILRGPRDERGGGC